MERNTKEDGNGANKKRPYKMADLKAFVESRLLSRSEKTLEKIGCKRSNSRTSLLQTADKVTLAVLLSITKGIFHAL